MAEDLAVPQDPVLGDAIAIDILPEPSVAQSLVPTHASGMNNPAQNFPVVQDLVAWDANANQTPAEEFVLPQSSPTGGAIPTRDPAALGRVGAPVGQNALADYARPTGNRTADSQTKPSAAEAEVYSAAVQA